MDLEEWRLVSQKSGALGSSGHKYMPRQLFVGEEQIKHHMRGSWALSANFWLLFEERAIDLGVFEWRATNDGNSISVSASL